MIDVPAFDNLQQAAPETKLLTMHFAVKGFSEIRIKPPKEVLEYFQDFLGKAKNCIDARSCHIELFPSGSIVVSLQLSDRCYPISQDDPSPRGVQE